MVDIGRVPMLPRSALACWWSITHLIRSYPGDCYFWTFTSGQVVPDHWFANMHSRLVCIVKNMAARETRSSDGGTIPKNWGGVRVIEVHPDGHGLHSHWVVRGRYPWELMQRAALKAGLGKVVWVDPDPATKATAYYLASYMTKEGKLHGIRQWANIGTYDGIGKRDIEIDSDRIREIKAWQFYYRSQGDKRFVAYRKALAAVDEGKSLSVPF